MESMVGVALGSFWTGKRTIIPKSTCFWCAFYSVDHDRIKSILPGYFYRSLFAPLSAADMTSQIGSPVTPAGTVGCMPDQIMISSPKPGGDVTGKIILTGTVDVPNFGFYKYEYSPQGSETWATIAAGNQIVHNGELGVWDTSQLVSGDYQIRLVVTDNLGKSMPACIVPLHIKTQ
jgi:hypothetical protein